MVTPIVSLLNLAQTGQALALTGKNLQIAKKKKITTKDILGLGVTNIAGISIIKSTADIAAGI